MERRKDVEVENDPTGKPFVLLYGKMKELLAGSRIMVSISHSENVVVAFAVIEK
jgi:holo-[acyl-carrier protein] synthase